MTNCPYIDGVSGVKCKLYEYDSITEEYKERFCHNPIIDKFIPGTQIRREQCEMKSRLDELVSLKI